MDPEGQLRNLRDFLLVYNRMTEICFQRCSSNFNYRSLTMDEERCADNCAGKLIRSNHRLMGTYVHLMPAMVQKRMEEMESKAAEVAKATQAGESVEPLSAGLKSSDISSTFAQPQPGVLTPTSAAEQAGSAASSGALQSAPTLSTNEAFGSPDRSRTFPLVTESAHTAAAEPPVVAPALDTTPPRLAGIHLKNVDANHIGAVSGSISPRTSPHQATGVEGPPS